MRTPWVVMATRHPNRYRAMLKKLVEARHERGLRQIEMAEIMGVRVEAVNQAVDDFERLAAPVSMAGTAPSGGSAYRLDGRLNASFHAVNLLFANGASIKRVDQAAGTLEVGDFIVEKFNGNDGTDTVTY